MAGDLARSRLPGGSFESNGLRVEAGKSTTNTYSLLTPPGPHDINSPRSYRTLSALRGGIVSVQPHRNVTNPMANENPKMKPMFLPEVENNPAPGPYADNIRMMQQSGAE